MTICIFTSKCAYNLPGKSLLFISKNFSLEIWSYKSLRVILFLFLFLWYPYLCTFLFHVVCFLSFFSCSSYLLFTTFSMWFLVTKLRLNLVINFVVTMKGRSQLLNIVVILLKFSKFMSLFIISCIFYTTLSLLYINTMD